MEEVRLNVHLPPGEDGQIVQEHARRYGLSGHLFRTSGTTGGAKWVHLTDAAVQASAQAACDHLRITSSEVWLRALPQFHVGGFMIGERARVSGSQVRDLFGPWDAASFMSALAQRVTASSLVPTQLFDLVALNTSPPASLRLVLVGGAALEDKLYDRAVSLGWPVLRTFGMTETASQLATETSVGSGALEALPGWTLRTDDEQILSIKGPALFSGYLTQQGGYAETGEWFRSSDKVLLSDRNLTPLGRANRVVKVLGELVNLEEIEKELPVVIVPREAERRGQELFAVTEDKSLAIDQVRAWNASTIGPRRISGLVRLSKIPRNALGKVKFSELQDQIDDFKVIRV